MYVSDIKYQYIFTFKFTCRINKKIPNMLTIIKESASNMFKNMGIIPRTQGSQKQVTGPPKDHFTKLA